MSDRTCDVCGTPLAASWSMRGGHQTGSSACKVAKHARTMNEIDYCYVTGPDSVELKSRGVDVRYGFVWSGGGTSPTQGFANVSATSTTNKAVVGAFAPKFAVYLFGATQGLNFPATLRRAAADLEFRAAIVAVAEIAMMSGGDIGSADARKAVRAYLANERLL